MSLQFPGIRLEQVRDPGTRAALSSLDRHVRSIATTLGTALETDEGPGLLRFRRPMLIPELAEDPTSQSTYGRVGEIRRVGRRMFLKQGIDDTDTDWEEIPLATSGGATPTATIGLAAIPGSAATWMRSDAAPALSQNIAPAWTQPHRFTLGLTLDEQAAPATPAANRLALYAKDVGGVSSLFFMSDDGAEHQLSELDLAANYDWTGKHDFTSASSGGDPTVRITRPAVASSGDPQLRLAFDASNYSDITEWQNELYFAGVGNYYDTALYTYQFRGDPSGGAWVSLHAGPWGSTTAGDLTGMRRSLRIYSGGGATEYVSLYHSANVNASQYSGQFIDGYGVLNLLGSGNGYVGFGLTGVKVAFGVPNGSTPDSPTIYAEVRDATSTDGAGLYMVDSGNMNRVLTNVRRLYVTSPVTITGTGFLKNDPTIAFDGTAALTNNARVAVSKNSGATVGTRRRVNFIEGSNVTLTIADDAGNEEIDVTINASTTGGSEPSDGDKGDITVSGSGLTWTIDNDAVTFAKLQNIATQRLVGRWTAATGDAEETTIAQALEWLSSTRGALARRGASGWEGFAPGTLGYVLTSNGAGADPTWQALPGGLDAWTTMSDGTNTATPTGADTFRFRTTGSGLSLTVTNNEVTYGDNLKIDLVFANPSQTIGLTANNGTATTPMRSDATPALRTDIAPTWSGQHTFTYNTAGAIALTSGRWIDMNGVRITAAVAGLQFGSSSTDAWGFSGATPVARSTGWSVTNEDGTTKSFDANSVTLNTIADVLGNLIEALKAHGILGG